MGKIVKYCNACEESFTEKFGFCPICGESLEAFEMKPVSEEVPVEKEVSRDSVKETPVIEEPAQEVAASFETADLPAIEETASEDDFELELTDEIAEEAEPIARPKFSVAGSSSGLGADVSESTYETTIDYTNYKPIDSGANSFASNDPDDDFHVTVLTEKNVKERNMLFLGVMVLMLALSVGTVIGSIFNHPLLVGAIGEDELLAFVPVVEQIPMTVEEEKQKANDEDAGGGGGGGREEQTDTSKGRLATQTAKPIIAPDKSIVQKDFELKQPIASTQGTKVAEQTPDPYGDPNSALAKLSNGMGIGGGQGSGQGTGQGSGRGTGQGTGIGSGSGSGTGDGNGGGTGTGTSGSRDPEPRTTGPTTSVKFISKPQPKYTDAARQNNIQGQVVLRITFLANGQIGSISPVSGLSYGLTEQAIAAARQIRFEPAMRNGQPYSITKSVQYTFTIY
ncbi:MAG: TonB family protein [Pyrinomonadaceae bacterium]|nr:TonB family protein [Pyrinomonadaceae bacterium]